MDSFSEFENYRKRYLIDYFRKMIIASEKNNLLTVHSYLTTSYSFIAFESFSLMYCVKRYLIRPEGVKVLSINNITRFLLLISSITLVNLNIFLRNSFNEYPFQNSDISLPFEERVLSKVNDNQKINTKLACFLHSYTSPGFCIYKDVFLLKFLNIVLLPYIVYLNYLKEHNRKEGEI